jgi:hypothetical protein
MGRDLCQNKSRSTGSLNGRCLDEKCRKASKYLPS